MNTFTVCFFGHREVENLFEMENRLEKLICTIIESNEYVEFLVGRDGEFDQLASSTVRRVAKRYNYGNSSLVLVLPYMRAEYRDNEQSFLEYYDEVEVCSESSQAHFKAAIQIRNRSMIDRSDLVICCIQRKSGGAYKAVRYAEQCQCRIINIAEEN